MNTDSNSTADTDRSPGAPEAPAAAWGATHIEFVDTDQLDRLLQEYDDVLVLFTTEWCGSCEELVPHLDAFAARHGERVCVVAVDGDLQPDLAHRYQVGAFPCLVLCHAGGRVWQKAGAGDWSSADEVERWILALTEAASRLSSLDTGPVATTREPRTVTVPDLSASDVTVHTDTADYPKVEAGIHRLDEGIRLTMYMPVDHRRTPPVDVAVLELFEPGSIDSLTLMSASGVSLADLAASPALSRLDNLMILGPGEIEAAGLGVFAALKSAHLAAKPDPALRELLVVNGGWAHPELAATLAALEPTPDRVQEPAPLRAEAAGERARRLADRVVLLDFTASWCPPCLEIQPALEQLAADRPELTLVAIDTDVEPAAMVEFEVHVLPTLILLVDGQVVWRSSSVGAEGHVRDDVVPAVDEALAPPDATRRRLPGLRPRPARTLTLPPGPLPFHLKLSRPDLDASEATRITTGGAVDVPAGWLVHLMILDGGVGQTSEPFVWSSLAGLGPDDIDEIEYCADQAISDDCIEALARFSTLRRLVLQCEVSPEALLHLEGFLWLRVLDIENDTLPIQVVEGLGRALPLTVVNGAWSALHAHAPICGTPT